MRIPERALLKRAVAIQTVRIKIPSGGSGAAEHYRELWPDVNPLPGESIPLDLGQHFPILRVLDNEHHENVIIVVGVGQVPKTLDNRGADALDDERTGRISGMVRLRRTWRSRLWVQC